MFLLMWFSSCRAVGFGLSGIEFAAAQFDQGIVEVMQGEKEVSMRAVSTGQLDLISDEVEIAGEEENIVPYT
jgi:hypothetical protein